MVKIRLARGGSKKRPFYSIIVSDQRRQRRGRFMAQLGFFNSMAGESDESLRIDTERADYWISQGAQPSERVANILKPVKRKAAA